MINTFKLNIKLKRLSKEFDFNLSFNSNIKINFIENNKNMSLIKISIGTSIAHILNILFLV